MVGAGVLGGAALCENDGTARAVNAPANNALRKNEFMDLSYLGFVICLRAASTVLELLGLLKHSMGTKVARSRHANSGREVNCVTKGTVK
jgi:hypothetical protein